ncbi:MAG: AAA family ATPase, partial [Opitutales bacterium]|nr:AAA family ATPase [Opitutales bacterium]
GLRDFRHLGPLVGDLRAHMARLLRDHRSGGNCFFHGPPGTGKTELARALARSLRCPLIEILGADTEGDPIVAAKRLENLRATQQLLRDRRVILLFDECEDVFRGESLFRTGLANQRKAWMNRLLENNPMPVIWISNSKGCLDRAFTRRFDIIAEVRSPPEHQRRRLYRRMCAGTVGEPVLHRLAALDQVTPAVVARAQSVAAGLHTCAEARDATFSRLIEATLHAQGHSAPRLRPSAQPAPLRFDHTYLNPDPPLDELIARLDKVASCRCLLHGPPGTGKTAFGRWLAHERGSPLHIKRASDLLSPFHGMSEQLLAEAFREAEEERALLMIDEVDTFLRDRRDARHGWEVSQVNEFLTCLENFEGIFLCSTNLAATLDPACLRRFDLKVHLGPLEPPQSRRLLAAHCRHLGLGRPSPAGLETAAALANATPGDFANAARQHTFQPFPSPAAFLTAVERECVAKNASATRKAGFS